MKTKRDLARYLDDYGVHEDDIRVGGIKSEDVADVLEQGLNAFESVNNIKLIFREN